MPSHRINKLGTHAHHRDRSAAAAIFANGTYFLDTLRTYRHNLYIYTYMHTCIYTHTYSYTYTYIRTYIYTCIAYMCTYTYIHTYIHVIYIYIYIYIYINSVDLTNTIHFSSPNFLILQINSLSHFEYGWLSKQV